MFLYQMALQFPKDIIVEIADVRGGGRAKVSLTADYHSREAFLAICMTV